MDFPLFIGVSAIFRVPLSVFCKIEIISSTRANVEEQETEEDEGKVDDLTLEVLLVEEQGAKEEGDDNTAATDHRHDADHGTWLAERIEIEEVGRAQEDADERDAPVPMEQRLPATGPPEEHQHAEHHEALVDVIPALHHHPVESYPALFHWRHQVLVVQSANSTQQGCQHNEVYPVVMLEIYPFFLPAATEHIERDNGEQDTDPLIDVETFAKEQERTHQDHHGSCSIDRSDNGKGQVLHGEIAEHPAGQDDERFQQDVFMSFPSAGGHMEDAVIQYRAMRREDDKGQKDQG